MCEWPKTTASASGKARRIRARRPRAAPGVMDHADRQPVEVDLDPLRQPPAQRRLVDVAMNGDEGRPDRGDLLVGLLAA